MFRTGMVGMLALLALSVASAADKTVWDGVYSPAQAERGKQLYVMSCQMCHGENLGGGFDGPEQVPALKREDFGRSRQDLNNLYAFVLESMPRNEPGNLSAKGAVDVIAYLLQQNGYPSGSAELSPDPSILEAIQFTSKP